MTPTPRKPLIDNRLRNVLLSMLACIALMVAYYMAIGQDKIPPDTRILYQGCLGAPCHAFRLTLDGMGAVSLSDSAGARTYKVSAFAVRRVLRTFKRQGFLDRDITAYSAGNGPACLLSLQAAHRKTALTHLCETPAPEITKPVAALEEATRFREILAGDRRVAHDPGVSSAP